MKAFSKKQARFTFKTCILLACTILLGMSNGEKPWVKDTDKDGVTVYLRDYEGSKVKEFKAQTKVNAPIKSILNLLVDIKSYPKWVFNNKNSFLIENKNNKEYIYYTQIKCPKPTEDRDAVIQFKIVELSDSKCVIKTIALPKYIAEKPGIIRVKEFSGGWELTKISENETMVTTQSHTEPSGTVPVWLLNYFITTGPHTTLINMRNIFKK